MRTPDVRVAGRWILLAAAGLGAVVGTSRVFGGDSHGGAGYLASEAAYGQVRSVISTTGTINALTTIEVSSELSGRIAEVHVDFNDEVAAGEPLARLDQATFAAQIDEARAAVAVARAQVEIARASIRHAEIALASAGAAAAIYAARRAEAAAGLQAAHNELRRQERLQTRGSTPEAEVERARSHRDAAAAAVAAAEAEEEVHRYTVEMARQEVTRAEAEQANAAAAVSLAEARLSQAETAFERTIIRAPIDGTVLDMEAAPGRTVAATLEAPKLFSIARDLRQIAVHALVDEADIGLVHLGQQAVFAVDAFPDRRFEGEVAQIRRSPEVVQNVGRRPSARTEQHRTGFARRTLVRRGPTSPQSRPSDRQRARSSRWPSESVSESTGTRPLHWD